MIPIPELLKLSKLLDGVASTLRGTDEVIFKAWMTRRGSFIQKFMLNALKDDDVRDFLKQYAVTLSEQLESYLRLGPPDEPAQMVIDYSEGIYIQTERFIRARDKK